MNIAAQQQQRSSGARHGAPTYRQLQAAGHVVVRQCVAAPRCKPRLPRPRQVLHPQLGGVEGRRIQQRRTQRLQVQRRGRQHSSEHSRAVLHGLCTFKPDSQAGCKKAIAAPALERCRRTCWRRRRGAVRVQRQGARQAARRLAPCHPASKLLPALLLQVGPGQAPLLLRPRANAIAPAKPPGAP